MGWRRTVADCSCVCVCTLREDMVSADEDEEVKGS